MNTKMRILILGLVITLSSLATTVSAKPSTGPTQPEIYDMVKEISDDLDTIQSDLDTIQESLGTGNPESGAQVLVSPPIPANTVSCTFRNDSGEELPISSTLYIGVYGDPAYVPIEIPVAVDVAAGSMHSNGWGSSLDSMPKHIYCRVEWIGYPEDVQASLCGTHLVQIAVGDAPRMVGSGCIELH